ncbi:MAG: acylphosphatase [Patescibacteria group bacterium]|nr:acylphosphatase [Patescibacteria group bacterium]
MDEKVRAHIFVSGRVQGVFFRHHTCIKAEELGVSGWVRNLEDNKVEAIFEGEKEKVGKMVDWVKKGPDSASVNNSEVEWEEYKGEFNSFEKIRNKNMQL